MEYIVKLGTIHHRRAGPPNALARSPEIVIRAGTTFDPALIGMDDATVQHMLRAGTIALPDQPEATAPAPEPKHKVLTPHLAPGHR
jgi:hypothetical protein